VSRNISPLDNSVLTIGTVRAGTRYNVVADTCEMEGTCRNQNSLVRDSMPERIERIVKGVAEGMGARCSVNYVKGYTPLINHTGMHDLLVKTAADVIGAERIRSMEQPLLIGEDFSFYADRIPGIFFLLGCRREDSPFQPLHSDRFAPDEAALKTGTHLLTASALRFLDGDL